MRPSQFLGAVLLFACFSPSALAQGEITIPGEYSKHIQSRGAIEPLEKDIFGEQVSLYTGAVEFVQTDVELPGNNALRVMVGRRFTPLQSLRVFSGIPTSVGLFADWDLEVPRLHGVVSSYGWIVPEYQGQRC